MEKVEPKNKLVDELKNTQQQKIESLKAELNTKQLLLEAPKEYRSLRTRLNFDEEEIQLSKDLEVLTSDTQVFNKYKDFTILSDTDVYDIINKKSYGICRLRDYKHKTPVQILASLDKFLKDNPTYDNNDLDDLFIMYPAYLDSKKHKNTKEIIKNRKAEDCDEVILLYKTSEYRYYSKNYFILIDSVGQSVKNKNNFKSFVFKLFKAENSLEESTGKSFLVFAGIFLIFQTLGIAIFGGEIALSNYTNSLVFFGVIFFINAVINYLSWRIENSLVLADDREYSRYNQYLCDTFKISNLNRTSIFLKNLSKSNLKYIYSNIIKKYVIWLLLFFTLMSIYTVTCIETFYYVESTRPNKFVIYNKDYNANQIIKVEALKRNGLFDYQKQNSDLK